MNNKNFNNLDDYIEYLEDEVKLSIAATQTEILNPNSNEGLSSVLRDMLFTIFEEDSEKIKNMTEENFITYALQLAQEYIKYKQTQKEQILAVNLAFLILTEFEKYVVEINQDYDELYLLASALFITMLILNPLERIKKVFSDLPIIETNLIKLRNTTLNEILYNAKFPVSSPIFSLKYVFENLDEFYITWGKNEEFEKLKSFINRPFDVEQIWGY